MNGTSKNIDLMEQKPYIKELLSKTWSFDGLELVDDSGYSDPLDAIVDTALKTGEHDALFWLNRFDNSLALKLAERKEFLNDKEPEFYHYDDQFNFLTQMLFNAYDHSNHPVDADGNQWSYDKKAQDAYFKVKNLFKNNQYQYVAPNNYAEMREKYRWDEAACLIKKDLFHGYKDPNFDIEQKLQISNILYDDVDQARSPDYMLVSIIYGYALGIREHNNTIEFIKEVNKIKTDEPFSTGGQWNEPQTKWLKLLSLYTNKNIYMDLTNEIRRSSLEQKEAFKNLTEDEKEARRNVIAEKLIGEIKSEEAEEKIKPKQRPKPGF